MATTPVATAEIAESLGLTENELFERALESLLQDRKREVLQHRLDIRRGTVPVLCLIWNPGSPKGLYPNTLPGKI